MEQHPVPQHIASFEFKLFGNLTLKQFITLSIPMSFAIIIFFSNVPIIIRFPVSIAFAAFGFFIALVPINGKSFDKWIVAFIKAILSPTQRIWIKETKLPEFLNVVVSPPSPTDSILTSYSGENKEKLMAYIKSLPKENQNPLDKKEDAAIENLGLESYVPAQTQTPPPVFISAGQAQSMPPQVSLPQLGNIQIPQPAKPASPYQGKLQESLPQIQKSKTQAVPQKLNPHAKPYVLPGTETRFDTKNIPLIKETERPQPKTHLASDNSFSIEEIVSFRAPNMRISFIPIIGKTRVRKLHFAPPPGYETASPVKGEKTFEISSELKKRFSDMEPAVKNIMEAGLTPALSKDKPKTIKSSFFQKPAVHISQQADLKLKTEDSESINAQVKINTKTFDQQKEQKFATMASIIPLTSKPNVISGIVSGPDGNSLEGIILVIHDANGIPVRAIKTNKLGQFISATPLPNGRYTIEIEGQGVGFDVISLNLNGQVLSPMEIKAKGAPSGTES